MPARKGNPRGGKPARKMVSSRTLEERERAAKRFAEKVANVDEKMLNPLIKGVWPSSIGQLAR